LNHARLLTNREANTLAEAAECVDWYRCRWEIEICQPYNLCKSELKRHHATSNGRRPWSAATASA